MKFNSPSKIYIYTSKYRGSEKPMSERKREREGGRESERYHEDEKHQVFLVILEGNHKQTIFILC